MAKLQLSFACGLYDRGTLYHYAPPRPTSSHVIGIFAKHRRVSYDLKSARRE
jgi:hypothetical protein